jgi:uncharacterized protein (DUF362 family)
MQEDDKKVCIIKDSDVHKAISLALEPFQSVIENGARQYPSILIKPNLCGGVPGEPGSHTSIEAVRAVTGILKSFNVPLVIGEADCSFNDTADVFKVLGLHKLAKDLGVQVVNLSEGPYTDLAVPRPLSMKTVRVARIITESFIVSAPVLKTHPWSGITINMKNMYGAIYEPEKAVYHNGLEKNIVDINKAIPPHLCVTDASFAVVRGGFKYGLWVGVPPTRLDTIIAGTNNVAVDAVGITLLRRDPWSIGHIKHAVEQGLGICDIKQLSITGNARDAVLAV